MTWPDGTRQGDSGDIVARLEREGPSTLAGPRLRPPTLGSEASLGRERPRASSPPSPRVVGRPGPSLDEGLPADEIARGRALEAEAQGPVYFAGLYTVFVTAEGWAAQRPGVAAGLPLLLRPFLPALLRRSQVQKCARNGFADDRGYDDAVRAVDVLSAALGDQPFFFGERPRTFDCSIWGPLLLLAYTPIDNPPRRRLLADDRLLAFVDRAARAGQITLPPLP